MKKAKVSRLLAKAKADAFTHGREVGIREERDRTTAYLQPGPGTFDLAPPPSKLYLEVPVLRGSFAEYRSSVDPRRAIAGTVRFRAVANVIALEPRPDFGPQQVVRYFTWERC